MTLEAWSVLARLHGLSLEMSPSGAVWLAHDPTKKHEGAYGAWCSENDYVLYRADRTNIITGSPK